MGSTLKMESAERKMPERTNLMLDWLQSNTPFIYAIALSFWGGFVQYANRVRSGEKWSWLAMGLDIVVCSFAGVVAFFLCQSLGIFGWQAAVVIAVSAHEGTRAIGVLVAWRDKLIGGGR